MVSMLQPKGLKKVGWIGKDVRVHDTLVGYYPDQVLHKHLWTTFPTKKLI